MQAMFEKSVSALLAVSAISIAGALIHREFFAPTTASSVAKSEYVADWRAALPVSHIVGNPQAAVTIVEFSDLECPFCKRFHQALKKVQEKHPGEVNYSFVHFPLPLHKQALGAARAAECASQSGRFDQALDVIFANQESLGRPDWAWLTAGAGIPDTRSFARCMADSTTPLMVQRGLALGTRMKVNGTPTILLNGWRYGGPPADSEIMRAVEDLLAGRKPYKGFPEKALRAQQ